MAAKFPFAKYFGEINLLTALRFLPYEKRNFVRPPTNPEQKDLLLYLGCNVLRTAHLAETAIDVLKAMGFEFNAVGGPAYCAELCTTGTRSQKLPKATPGAACDTMFRPPITRAKSPVEFPENDTFPESVAPAAAELSENIVVPLIVALSAVVESAKHAPPLNTALPTVDWL